MIHGWARSLTSPPAPMNAAASARPVAQIDDGAGERHGKLAEALIGVFLAFRIGVGEEAADGEQQDGAKAQAKIGSHDEARNFSHEYRRDEDKEEPEAAKPAC